MRYAPASAPRAGLCITPLTRLLLLLLLLMQPSLRSDREPCETINDARMYGDAAMCADATMYADAT